MNDSTNMYMNDAAQAPTVANMKQSVNDSKEELLKALQSDFATNVNKVYVNSLGKEVGFKEITVQKQKNLSRILIANENRKDVVYDAQCAMINDSALLDGFDVYELTEFDRIKLMLALYQSNVFADEVKFTCPVCGTQNSYNVGFDNTLRKLDAFDIKPQSFEYENKNFKFVFDVAYPLVKTMSMFYKSQYAKGLAFQSNQKPNTNNHIDNIEQMNLFVRKLKMTNKDTGIVREIDFSKYNVTDISDIFAMFPQDVVYSDNGIINIITTKFINQLNNSFDKHTCSSCGTVYEQDGSNQVESFL